MTSASSLFSSLPKPFETTMAPMPDLPPSSPWEPRLQAGGGSLGEELASAGEDWLGTHRGSWIDATGAQTFPGAGLPELGGRYTDLHLLGKGATSSVFRAMDTLLRRPVALKLLHVPGEGALAEARAQAQVEHPNVCRIYEVGAGFLVMQLLDGPTLADLAPGLDRSVALAYLRDVALGVHAAHLRGLLHLDLKLNNVLTFRHPDGTFTPAVGDFGMTRAGEDRDPALPRPLGTPPYTSPEQMDPALAPLSPASDVYSLGVMLYIVLTGRSPFGTTAPAGLPEAIAKGRWIPLRQAGPSLPKDLVFLVERCLQRDPRKRYGSAKALAEDLERLLAQDPLEGLGRAWGYRIRKRLQKNRRLVAAFALGVVPLSLALAFGWRQGRSVVEQAAWDHHFQVLVKDLQVGLETAYRRPPHDIQPELDTALAAVRGIEKEMADHGVTAQGPGHLALAQAALALGSGIQEVKQHFDAAWALGYRTEAVRKGIDTLRALSPATGALPLPAMAREGAERGLDRNPMGKVSLEQVRLAFLLGREGLEDDEDWNLQKFLELARAYRRKAPNDLQALLSEWDATLNLLEGYRLESVRPGGRRIPLEDLRASLVSLMSEGILLAPSHPGTYLRLAQTARSPVLKPWNRPPEARAQLVRAQEWFDQGFRVCARDRALNGAYLDYLAWDALGAGWKVEEARDAFRRQVAEHPEQAATASAAILHHVQECEQRNLPALAYGNETLRLLWKEYGKGKAPAEPGPSLAQASIHLADLAQERGYDAGPALALAREILEACQTKEPAWQDLRLKMALVASLQAEAGPGPRPDPGEVERLASGLTLDTAATFALALHRCRVQGTPETWANLKHLTQDGSLSKDRFLACLSLPDLAPARLELLEYQASLGQPIQASLEDLKRTLRGLLADRPDQPNGLIHALLARTALLEWPSSDRPREVLEAGLQEVTLALAPAPWSPAALETVGWAHGPGPSRLLGLRGRLYLALARREEGSRRSTLARKALESFHRALERAPALEGTLDPFVTAARKLLLSRCFLPSRTLPAPSPVPEAHPWPPAN